MRGSHRPSAAGITAASPVGGGHGDAGHYRVPATGGPRRDRRDSGRGGGRGAAVVAGAGGNRRRGPRGGAGAPVALRNHAGVPGAAGSQVHQRAAPSGRPVGGPEAVGGGRGGRMTLMRLQRAMARAGFGSRRGAEELIRAGRVRVNGVVATLGMSVDPARDVILIGSRRVVPARTEWVVLHKPLGYVG